MTGGRVAFDVWFGPVKRHWVAEMGSAMPGRQFVDRQLEGPFASWEHVHRFVPDRRRASSELLDHIEYSLPAGGLTDSVGEGPAGKTLSRLFRFRHERTRLDLGRHAEWADRPRLKVAIAGASGLIGSHLADYLTTAGHRVVRLVRNKEAGPDEIPWDPADRGALPRRPRGRRRHRQPRGRLARRRLDPGPQEGHPRAAACRRRGRSPRRSPAWTHRRRSSSARPRWAPTAPAAARRSPSRRLGATGFLADVCRAWEEAATPGAGRRRPRW